MDECVPGALGTSASLALRLGQSIFSISSLLFMCLGVQFYSYTAFWSKKAGEITRRIEGLIMASFCFPLVLSQNSETTRLVSLSSLSLEEDCFLVTIMGLVIPWSLTLAVVDMLSVFVKPPSRQLGLVTIIVIGDWVLSFLSLAAACSTASVTDALINSQTSVCSEKLCSRYQLSAAMAFLSWCLSFASSFFNLWLLPSL
ncbi:hypothetical protein LguiA_017397 [Lonicera macranthoides]